MISWGFFTFHVPKFLFALLYFPYKLCWTIRNIHIMSMSLNFSSSNAESLEGKIYKDPPMLSFQVGSPDGILLHYIQLRKLPFKKYVSTNPSGISDYYDSWVIGRKKKILNWKPGSLPDRKLENDWSEIKK